MFDGDESLSQFSQLLKENLICFLFLFIKSKNAKLYNYGSEAIYKLYSYKNQPLIIMI